jgi:hypothetical protein
MSLTMMGHLDLADGGHTRAQALLGEAASQFADTGNLMFVPWCMEGLAGVAAARRDHERAAELDGRATPCAPRSAYCIHLCIRPPTRERWPPLTPALRQQPSTRPAPGQPIRRRSRSSRQPQATGTRRQGHPRSDRAKLADLRAAAWFLETYLAPADSICLRP